MAKPLYPLPKIVIQPLPDYVARINKEGTIVYIDPSAPRKIHRPLVFHEMATWIMIFVFGFKAADIENDPDHEHIEETVEKLDGIDDPWYDKTVADCMRVIDAREPKPDLPADCLKD